MVFTGAVPWAELPAHYAAGDVYAMPCRTRAGGLDVEGLGIVYLEASACGRPVMGGDSGGAPDAVLRRARPASWSAAATSPRLSGPARWSCWPTRASGRDGRGRAGLGGGGVALGHAGGPDGLDAEWLSE